MNTKFGKGLQEIGDAIKPKLTKAVDFGKGLAKRAQPLAAIGVAGNTRS